MTGPEGDQPHGWWGVTSVDAPFLLEFENGLADLSGMPHTTMPTMMIRVALSEQPDGITRMEIETTFPSVDAMERFIAMGMQEGMAGAMSQIDAILG